MEKAGERVGELAAAGDLELAVDMAEVGLGGLGGDEQRLRDLSIGAALRGEPCARSSPVVSASRPVIASRLGLAPAAIIPACLVGDPARTHVVGEIEPALKLRARLDASAGAAQRSAVIGERAGELQRW